MVPIQPLFKWKGLFIPVEISATFYCRKIAGWIDQHDVYKHSALAISLLLCIVFVNSACCHKHIKLSCLNSHMPWHPEHNDISVYFVMAKYYFLIITWQHAQLTCRTLRVMDMSMFASKVWYPVKKICDPTIPHLNMISFQY